MLIVPKPAALYFASNFTFIKSIPLGYKGQKCELGLYEVN